MHKKEEISAALLGIIVALILWLTILSREAQVGGISFYKPIHSIIHLWKDIQRGGLRGNFIGNLVLFIPAGALIPLVTGWKKMWKIAVTGLCFSLIIETIQLVTKRGVFDPDDILLNCLGCIIGYELLNMIIKLVKKRELSDAIN